MTVFCMLDDVENGGYSALDEAAIQMHFSFFGQMRESLLRPILGPEVIRTSVEKPGVTCVQSGLEADF